MIKIKGKFWLLALCLSLVFNIPLASSSLQEGSQTEVNADKEEIQQQIQQEVQQQIQQQIQQEVQQQIQQQVQPQIQLEVQQQIQQQVQLQIKQEVRQQMAANESFFRPTLTIVDIILLLLIVFCYYTFRKTNSNLRSVIEDLKSYKSDVATKLEKMEERLSTLEEIVSNLKEVVADLRREIETLKKENRKEQPPKSQQSYFPPFDKTTDKINNLQKIDTKGTTSQIPTSDKATSNRTTKPGPIEIQRITKAFNDMMIKKDRMTDGSMDLLELQKNFIDHYKISTFKCVNSTDRINSSEKQPRFEECQASESTLWRIQLSDGIFAVLPSPSEYDSTAHLYGGMKELFKSDYRSGSY